MNEFTNKRVHRDQALRLQLAERGSGGVSVVLTAAGITANTVHLKIK